MHFKIRIFKLSNPKRGCIGRLRLVNLTCLVYYLSVKIYLYLNKAFKMLSLIGLNLNISIQNIKKIPDPPKNESLKLYKINQEVFQ